MTKTYRYQVKIWQMILCILLFAFCARVIWDDAFAGVSGPSFFRFITLGPVAGTAVMWWLVGFFLIFMLISVLGLLHSLTGKDVIVIDVAGITAPNRLIFGRSVFVPFRDITKFSDFNLRGVQILTIHHAGGKLALTRSAFDNRKTFEEVRQTLIDRADGRPA